MFPPRLTVLTAFCLLVENGSFDCPYSDFHLPYLQMTRKWETIDCVSQDFLKTVWFFLWVLMTNILLFCIYGLLLASFGRYFQLVTLTLNSKVFKARSIQTNNLIFSQVHFKVTSEKTVTYVITTDDDEDILFVVAQSLALLRYSFPGSKR